MDCMDILTELDWRQRYHHPDACPASPCNGPQVSYLGFCGTLGADYMQYMIADKTLVPPESRLFYTEKILYMPHTYFVNDHKQVFQARRLVLALALTLTSMSVIAMVSSRGCFLSCLSLMTLRLLPSVVQICCLGHHLLRLPPTYRGQDPRSTMLLTPSFREEWHPGPLAASSLNHPSFAFASLCTLRITLRSTFEMIPAIPLRSFWNMNNISQMYESGSVFNGIPANLTWKSRLDKCLNQYTRNPVRSIRLGPDLATNTSGIRRARGSVRPVQLQPALQDGSRHLLDMDGGTAEGAECSSVAAEVSAGRGGEHQGGS